ncbi:MAG: MoaD/ThiS family protein [Gemmatimonadaceae bacterium]
MSAVTVHLFASYAESFGANNLKIELAPESTVAELIAEVRSRPGSYVLPPLPRVAINRKFAAPDQLVRATDEIALIPPVSGG